MRSIFLGIWISTLACGQIAGNLLIAQPKTATQELKKMSVDDYIRQYAPIAQEEMKRSGIPASIKLAQGILESNFGNSELATKANNHFGIKCHKEWNGHSFVMDDDEKNECFRSYKRAEDSWKDHTEFLTSRPRYASLFELSATDYVSWAKGLKTAGYATNPNYANMLIRIIEERNLNRYDTEMVSRQPQEQRDEILRSVDNKIFVYNGIKTVIAMDNESLMDIALKYGVPIKKLEKYNDLRDVKNIPGGTKIYLASKKSKGHDKVHEVREGEDMITISQKQGILLKELYKKNGMEMGQEPAVGARLCLKKKCAQSPALKPQTPVSPPSVTQDVRVDVRSQNQGASGNVATIPTSSPRQTSPNIQNNTSTQEKSSNNTSVVQRVDSLKPNQSIIGETIITEESTPVIDSRPPFSIPAGKEAITHIVKPSETLFGLSRQYGVSLADLRYYNQLLIDEIKVDQVLVIGLRDRKEIIERSSSSVVRSGLHVVKAGESLSSIARQYNVSVADLKKENQLAQDQLRTGQELIIPSATLRSIAPDAFSMSANSVHQVIDPNEPEAVTTQITSASKHTIRQGETLFGIAKRYGVKVDDLKAWNPSMPDPIRVGEEIFVKNPGNSQASVVNTPQISNPTGSVKIHEVVAGETLFRIASQHGVTVAQLVEWNQLSNQTVKIGQKLIVSPKP